MSKSVKDIYLTHPPAKRKETISGTLDGKPFRFTTGLADPITMLENHVADEIIKDWF